jgi:hypothetical protein
MYIFKNYTHIINYNEKTTRIKMSVDVAESGEVQAVNQGLGGTNPNNGQRQVQGRNAMWYTYQNSIRVICPGSQREISRISNVDINKMLCHKYGTESKLIRNIDGMERGVNQGE